MNRPVIGITAYVERASWGRWVDVPGALVPHRYVRQVEDAGAIALVIPPRADADDDTARAAARAPRRRRARRRGRRGARALCRRAPPAVQVSRPDRDTTELAIARVSAELDLPLLGICRGMQVMAVEAGGQLEQHVPDRVGHDEHSPAPTVYGNHPVRTVAGTRVAQILGAEVDVPSYHHQSVLTHPGYVASAWADDGTLEAMEVPDAHFRARRAVAPRGRHRPSALRGPDRCGHRVVVPSSDRE